jgi:hypothetical protein
VQEFKNWDCEKTMADGRTILQLIVAGATILSFYILGSLVLVVYKEVSNREAIVRTVGRCIACTPIAGRAARVAREPDNNLP